MMDTAQQRIEEAAVLDAAYAAFEGCCRSSITLRTRPAACSPRW
jgi:hypothetical protein